MTSIAASPAHDQDAVIVWIDYNTAAGVAGSLYSAPQTPALDPLRLAEILIARRDRPSTLAEVRVWRPQPCPQREPAAARAFRRETAGWRHLPGVVVHTRPAYYPPSWPQRPKRTKDTLMALGLDLQWTSLATDFDAAIILSHDRDLRPAICSVRNQVCVEAAAWSGHPGRLRYDDDTNLPWCHHLGPDDYTGCLEYHRYAS